MVRAFAITAGALLAVALLSGQAQAQAMAFGSAARAHSIGRPTVSPYLNLVASDALSQTIGTAGGYQTMVRPYVDSRRAINANAAAIDQLEQAQGALGARGGRPGSAGRRNYSHYYPALSGR